jgi:SNF2 family DNA or RNA helicase
MHPSLDEVIFTWGKYSGQTLGTVRRSAPQYLQWITTTPGLPPVWIEAAKRALLNDDVSDLSLPRTKMSYVPKEEVETKTGPIEVHLKDSKTAYIVMPYNKLLLEQFKYEIDGRKWNGDEKHWEFPAVHLPKLSKLFPQAILSDPTQKLLKKLQERREDLDEIRELDDVEFDIPGLQLQLYPYQRTGVKFVDRAGGRCLIADAPGLGKTVQAIAYAQLHDLKTLIVCPLSVVVNWQREIKKFTGKESTIWDSKGYDGNIGGEVVGKIENYDGKLKSLLKKNDIID